MTGIKQTITKKATNIRDDSECSVLVILQLGFADFTINKPDGE